MSNALAEVERRSSDLDLRWIIAIIAFIFLGIALLALGVSAVAGYFGGPRAASSDMTIRHPITNVKPAWLTHWNDANGDGKIQKEERKKVVRKAGCYTFRVSEAHTKLDFGGAKSPYHELGSIMLLNGRLHNEPFELKEGQGIIASFYSFGKDKYPKVITATGYQVIHVTLEPVACPEE